MASFVFPSAQIYFNPLPLAVCIDVVAKSWALLFAATHMFCAGRAHLYALSTVILLSLTAPGHKEMMGGQ